jgi:hypothetical protein
MLPYNEHEGKYFYVDIDYITDTTGKLAKIALEWLRKEGKR